MSEIDAVDDEIRLLTKRKNDLTREEQILAMGEAEIRERDQLLKTPFMVELREILIQAFRKSNAVMKARMLSDIEQRAEKRMQNFYDELREIVAPEEPTIRESQVEDYVNKIVTGENVVPEDQTIPMSRVEELVAKILRDRNMSPGVN